ncbi:hypothetical protein TMatcc_007812 [Talaromyces marneffei ATCC 18224]|uniref:uncharacterized protein n=1 Tax=Talaromyces marneffei TaxID=37727 RepID=UPI0012A9AA31|nr:uncharacterized protein EYB26_004734 [Talaromyces marneffei]KAE8552802.1 hypothetical protein EYB25_004181 [Talaromyces marneffei]QGA17064.1 hypothetical protein EYB26_004734 [Talaromyces marneffei]
MTDSITRLHISPLTPALLDSVLNPSIRPLATDISFHNIATFPENDYGFITLPSMEADKLKKKLNGSILKGKKFRVEAAREDPKKKKATTIEKDVSPKPTKTSSKRKAEDAEDNVLDGYELPADRQVKRGWTEPASAKRLKKQKKADKEASKSKLQPKSKYTEKEECLFRMKMPPNKMSETISKKNKSKKTRTPNEVVVHEFAQTFTHPSFLKSSASEKPITAKFEEGKGWMDEDGNVLEEMTSKKARTADYHPGKKDDAKERPVVKEKSRKAAAKERKQSPTPDEASSSEEEEPDWTSSSGSSESESDESDNNSGSESDDSSISDRKAKPMKNVQTTVKCKVTKNDERNEEENKSPSESDNDLEGSSEVDSEAKPPTSSEPAEATTNLQEVHPLEALFKRTPAEKNVSESPKPTFSFFADNDDDIEDEEEAATLPLEPLTPFSKQDRQIRDLRSGAPTPDTAVFNRRKLLLSEGDNDNDDDEEMDTDDDYDHTQLLAQETPSKPRIETSTQRQPEESDFVKWFWENRGDNNRAWKRRRREAAKEKRQRENRRKGLKGRG